MTTHTIKGFVIYEKDQWATKPSIDFRSYDPRKFSHFEGAVVSEHSIEVEVPDDFDPRADMIAQLQKKKETARAAYATMVKEIDDRINSLLAIENAAPAAAEV